jgi:hypothetical protein
MPLYSHARLHVPILFDLSKRMLFSAASDGRFGLKVLTSMEDVCLNSGASESSFRSRAFDKVVMQRDRVMKCNTSSVVRNRHIPQGEMDLSLKRELHGKPGGISYFHLSRYFTLFFDIETFFCCFLMFPHLYSNLRVRFLLRGEGCNTPCYNLPNYFH